eukprot:jgi/Orpsp1_1/1191205/evm.model.d7180000084106.1
MLQEKIEDTFYDFSKYNYINDMFNCEYNELTISKNDFYVENVNNYSLMKHYSTIIKDTDFKKLNEFFHKNEINPKYYFISIYGYIMSKYSGQNSVYTSLIQMNDKFNDKNLIENYDN